MGPSALPGSLESGSPSGFGEVGGSGEAPAPEPLVDPMGPFLVNAQVSSTMVGTVRWAGSKGAWTQRGLGGELWGY